MTKRTYRVSYWIEQGYALDVEAHSPAQACRIIRRRLDDENDRLEIGERVHHDHGVASVTLIKTKRRAD